MTAARTGQRLGPETPIPNKLYFKIGEVSQLVGVRAHVLRYWEKEISSIRPSKSASNQRRYRRRDVELFREIRRLLYEERYTLAGARKRLLTGNRDKDSTDVGSTEPVDIAPTPELTSIEAFAPDAGRDSAGDSSSPSQAETQPSVPSEVEPSPKASDPPPTEEEPVPQLDLGFAAAQDEERLDRLRAGLRDLIRMASDE